MTHGRLNVTRELVPLLSVLERAIESVAPALLDSNQKFVKTLPPASTMVGPPVVEPSAPLGEVGAVPTVTVPP